MKSREIILGNESTRFTSNHTNDIILIHKIVPFNRKCCYKDGNDKTVLLNKEIIIIINSVAQKNVYT